MCVNKTISTPKHHIYIPKNAFKDQASNSSDEQCEDDDDEEDEDSYYDEDGQLPAAMVMSTEKTAVQSAISNNGSGATLSIRNAKSVSKKSKPVINVRAVINVFTVLTYKFLLLLLLVLSIFFLFRFD